MRHFMKKFAVLATAAVMMGGSMDVSAAGVRDVFDAEYYADSYEDLKAAFGYDEAALYSHYITCGLNEGRCASPVFNLAQYRRNYADLNQAFGDNWDAYADHYRNIGIAEGRTSDVISAAVSNRSTGFNAWTIDYEKLAALSQANDETKWLADYITMLPPTGRNDFTGLFEGYNLIFLTAEAFSPYAVRADLTPTLYKMLHSSFVFNNYYVPLWQTSTSDGEYVNCTGLIPDGKNSMKKTAGNNMPYTLPRFFASRGVYSWGYHNHTLSYYDRHLTHPNLGYDFKAAKPGDLSAEEWASRLFVMEDPYAWPPSDYNMMVGSIPEYIGADRFHVYYMTVSGHLNYTFSGNRMARKNKDAVAGLNLSENSQAYIACQIELDKALQYLLAQLELAGKLENTVICLSADHYPYGLGLEHYEELAGKNLSGAMDLYRNGLILWNANIQEPVIVNKACCSVDLLPTLLNLFGFDFDSRMYAGRDIFSNEEGLVIFNDMSFVSDAVVYNQTQETATWLLDGLPQEVQDAYLNAKQQDVLARYLFSAYILRNNYYNIVQQCVDTAR